MAQRHVDPCKLQVYNGGGDPPGKSSITELGTRSLSPLMQLIVVPTLFTCASKRKVRFILFCSADDSQQPTLCTWDASVVFTTEKEFRTRSTEAGHSYKYKYKYINFDQYEPFACLVRLAQAFIVSNWISYPVRSLKGKIIISFDHDGFLVYAISYAGGG